MFNHFTVSFRRQLSYLASLLAISLLAAGCAGYTQRTIHGLAISANSLNFQTVTVGQKATKTFNIINTGTAPLQITAITVTNNEFSVTGPGLPEMVSAGSTVTYRIVFAPSTSGSVSGTVDISTNTSSQPATLPVKGNGQGVSANLVISPSVVNFGKLALQSTSTQNVTLQNTGDANLTLQGITVSGAGFGYSDLSPGFSLAPNQKVTFQVWFSPKAVGPATATLTLLSPNVTSGDTLSMLGDGISSSGSGSGSGSGSNSHSVALSWSASSSQVIGYRVYRSESSGGSYNSLTGTALTALNYTDTSVSAGNTYYYVVTSVDSAGVESVYSNQATAVIP